MGKRFGEGDRVVLHAADKWYHGHSAKVTRVLSFEVVHVDVFDHDGVLLGQVQTWQNKCKAPTE